ncbi:MAG TPA: RNA polymerase sigma factor [Chloroflexi bacterium]|nr:RNA polymerase sigma factor [Chloroflexota bacterium]
MDRSTESIPDQILVERAQKGDRDAFEALCERYLPVVYNRLGALLPPEAVEDVTQEVFVAVLRGIQHYRGRGSFRTWLSGVIRHKVADYYRRRHRRSQEIALEENIHGGKADDWEEQAHVRMALYRLPAHYQEVLLLRFAEGRPFKEIAEILDISLEATKSRYRRAVQAIARELGYDRPDKRGENG